MFMIDVATQLKKTRVKTKGGRTTCSSGTEDSNKSGLEDLVSIEREIPQEPGASCCQQTRPAQGEQAL